MLQLILNPNTLEERSFGLGTEPLKIGRAEENNVCYPHKSLSRQHARLELSDGRAILTDLGSKNGTFFNGQRVSRCELQAGDSFRCGEVSFLLTATDVQPTFIQELRTELLGSPEGLFEKSGDQNASALRVRQTDPAARTREKLQILLKVSQLLSSPDSIDSLLERILALVFDILAVDRAAILLVDPATGELRPRTTRSAESAGGKDITYSQKIVDYVRKHCVGALFGDARLDPRLGQSDSVMKEHICTSMCVPLKPKEELLGVLYVDNRSVVDRFSAEDLEFLTAFANQAAIAIENANLSRRLEAEAILRNNYLRFFPPATLKKLELSRSSSLEVIETEVTALFADISNFTVISSSMQPREVVDMLNEYFPVVSELVFRHEGTLEKYIGDALLAVWGAPFSHPDDVDRAVRTAVEMQQAVVELNARWRAAGKREIQIHIGLNTGRVAAGNIGSERYLQYATIGDSTNVASRICGVAESGEIVLSESTRARLREQPWPLHRLPPTSVKGKEGPLSLYRLGWNADGHSH